MAPLNDETPLRVSRSPPKFKWFAIKSVAFCSALQATTGWHLTVLSGTMAMIEEDTSPSAFWKGFLGCACLLGSLVVGFFSGQWADYLGRRPASIIYCALGLLFTVAQVFCRGVISLTIIRIFIGATLSLWYAVVPCIPSETCPAGSRGKMLSCVETFWYVGSILSILAGYVTHELDQSWKWPLVLPALPLGCGLLLSIVWLPETPAWLVQQNRVDEARAIAVKYTDNLILVDEADCRNGGALLLHSSSSMIDENDDEAQIGSADSMVRTIPERAGSSSSNVINTISSSSPLGSQSSSSRYLCGWDKLFSREQRLRTIYGALFWGCLVVPTFAIATFALEILDMLSIEDAYAGNLIISSFSLLGVISATLLIERIGRRMIVIPQFWATCVCLCTIGFWTSAPPTLLFILFVIYQFSNAFGAPLTVAYQAELFPTEIRATGGGFMSAVSRVFAIIGTFTMPFMLESWGVGPALIFAGAVAAVGAVVSHLWAPETSGLTLAEATRGGRRHKQSLSTTDLENGEIVAKVEVLNSPSTLVPSP